MPLMSTTKLSRLAETLQGSEIVRLGATIKEKMKQGEKIYNYTIGDFDSAVFPIPAELEEEIIKAYKDGYTHTLQQKVILNSGRLSRFLLQQSRV